MKNIPIINQTYHYFDDGKITESRRYNVRIIEVLPFKEASEDLIKKWLKEVEEAYWLFSKTTDYFIGAELENDEIIVFARTLDGGWFSLGFWGGRLDIDGELNKHINK